MTASPLEDHLIGEIRATGPISVARYMTLCLSHPEHGYYITRDPLGTDGDFTTAPEISQMFGEMVGLWVLAAMAALPERPRLVELGPGRGTLMADVLRVLDRAGDRPEVWLVETSPTLAAHQRDRIAEARQVETLDAVPDGPAIVLANEFLDALPIHQFLRTPEGWRERMVGLDAQGLCWGLSEPLPGAGHGPDDWAEVAPMADRVLADLGQRLTRHPGAALLIDYGYTRPERPPGPTLQAVRNHAHADPLSAPGSADLTWLVDFDRAAKAFQGPTGVLTQRAFLGRMGIGHRAAQLAETHAGQAASIADALERLTAPQQMGTLFKALASTSPGLAPPPVFEDMCQCSSP